MTRALARRRIGGAARHRGRAARNPIRRGPSPSSCPIPPAARPTWWRASSRRSSPPSSARTSSSRTSAAAAPTSRASACARSAPDGHTLYIPNLQILRQRVALQVAAVRHREGLRADRHDQQQPAGADRRASRSPPNTLPELVAWMKTTHGARWRIPAPAAPAISPRSCWRRRSASRSTTFPIAAPRPMLQDTLGGHVDLFFATPQQVVGRSPPARSRLRHHRRGALAAAAAACRASCRPTGRSSRSCSGTSCWRRPARRSRSSTRSTPRCRRRSQDPAILAAWAKTGVSAYPKEQQTPAGAAAYLKKEIAHWGQVVRDNKIEAPTN